MKPGRLIVLNGTSSSGKTSIARALQQAWSGPLLHLALDTAIGFLPLAYTGNGEHSAEGYRLRPDTRGGETVTRYEIGLIGRRLNDHLAALARALTDDGFDVVLDHVITDDATIVALATHARAGSSWLVGVTCDEATAIARERARGDRQIGLVRDQAERVHAGLRPYDLIVDTTAMSPGDAARAIVAVLDESPTGIRRLQAERDEPGSHDPAGKIAGLR